MKNTGKRIAKKAVANLLAIAAVPCAAVPLTAGSYDASSYWRSFSAQDGFGQHRSGGFAKPN